MPGKISLYASVGAELTQYDMDVDAAALRRRGTVSLPANVQYAWPHVSRQFLYVATSDSQSGMGRAGNTHHVSALRIGSDGALSAHGAPIPLPTRLTWRPGSCWWRSTIPVRSVSTASMRTARRVMK